MKKNILRLGMVFIVLSIALMGILSYMLCYVSIRLCNMIYSKEEFVALTFGIIFMGTIIGLFYTVLITWKEFNEKGLLK